MKNERYILFGQYLDNDLLAEEKVSFEKDLATDKELASEFETFRELNLHLENKFGAKNNLKDFEKTLKSISKEHFNNKKTKVFGLKPWQYAMVASVAILFGIFFFQNTDPSFKEYYKAETANFVERGAADETLKKAQDFFNKKEYASAIPHFESALIAQKSSEIQFYYAISLIELNQFAKADQNLVDISQGNSVYQNKAKWFLALSQLKQKNYNKTKRILKTIPLDDENHNQAQKLLKELD